MGFTLGNDLEKISDALLESLDRLQVGVNSLSRDPGDAKPVGFAIGVFLHLDGGFKYFLFSPLPGEDSQFD